MKKRVCYHLAENRLSGQLGAMNYVTSTSPDSRFSAKWASTFVNTCRHISTNAERFQLSAVCSDLRVEELGWLELLTDIQEPVGSSSVSPPHVPKRLMWMD